MHFSNPFKTRLKCCKANYGSLSMLVFLIVIKRACHKAIVSADIIQYPARVMLKYVINSDEST